MCQLVCVLVEGSGPKEIEEREMDFCTGMVSVSESSATNTTGGADQLGAALISSTYKIKQELADSYSVWQEIVVFGFGASFVVSWVFVVFMQCAPGMQLKPNPVHFHVARMVYWRRVPAQADDSDTIVLHRALLPGTWLRV